jgi:hypothetical protein
MKRSYRGGVGVRELEGQARKTREDFHLQKNNPVSGELTGSLLETLLNRCVRLANRETVCVI